MDSINVLESLQRLSRLTRRLAYGNHRGHRGSGRRHRQDETAAGDIVRSGARPTSHSDIRLLRLLKQESGQSAKDLAERMEIRPPSLSEALDRLEKRGMIQRQRDERDSRVVRISLTEQGAEALEQNGDENKYLQQQIDSCLTAEEKQTFCEICEKLSSHLTQLTEPKKEEGI